MRENTGDVDMTIEKGEQLSALIDGELDQNGSAKLLSELCKDNELKRCWQSYHVIRESMRGGMPDTFRHGFADQIMSAIESEPAILAPQTRFKPNIRISNPAAKRFAGFAIAASVATLAVIGVQSIYKDDPAVIHVASMPDQSEFVRLEQSSPQVAAANPVVTPKAENGFSTASAVSGSTTPAFKHPPIQNNFSIKSVDPQLLKYIVNHAQNASGSGVHDIFSPARIVTSSQQQGTSDKGEINRVQR